jgi:Flp pilus assembly protein TadD
MAATFIAAALIGGYTVFSHMSKTSAMTEGTAKAAEAAPADVIAALPQPAGIREIAAEHEANPTSTIALAANAINPPLAVIALPAIIASPVSPPADARTQRERGIFAYRGGDLTGALAHFNLAISQDPGFAPAYIDRGIVFYRMRNFERAFADMAQAKRLVKNDKSGKDKPKSVARAKPPAIVSHGPRPRWLMTAAVTP